MQDAYGYSMMGDGINRVAGPPPQQQQMQRPGLGSLVTGIGPFGAQPSSIQQQQQQQQQQHFNQNMVPRTSSGGPQLQQYPNSGLQGQGMFLGGGQLTGGAPGVGAWGNNGQNFAENNFPPLIPGMSQGSGQLVGLGSGGAARSFGPQGLPQGSGGLLLEGDLNGLSLSGLNSSMSMGGDSLLDGFPSHGPASNPNSMGGLQAPPLAGLNGISGIGGTAVGGGLGMGGPRGLIGGAVGAGMRTGLGLPPPGPNLAASSNMMGPGMAQGMGLGGVGMVGLGLGLSQQLMQSAPTSLSSGQPTPGPSESESNEGKYGLSGLLDVIRMSDNRDLQGLALGSDLLTLGLNLNSPDSLVGSFSSPFADQPTSAEPQYSIPNCYSMTPPPLRAEQLTLFKLETLMYMFYAVPKDIIQACAAQELYRREWRYHTELRLWLKPRTAAEMMQQQPSVQFTYFDVAQWEGRLFTTPVRGSLTAGLLSEEDVRVKVPLAGMASSSGSSAPAPLSTMP